MNALSIIQMMLIVLATGGALLSNFTTVKKEGKITGWGKAFLVGVIFSLGMAVLLEQLKADDEEEKTNKEISKYQGIISRSDSSLKKADTTIQKLDSNLFAATSILKKTDSSLTSLGILQDSSNRIIHNLNKQLFLQKTVYDSTKKVLDKTSSILKSVQEVVDYKNKITNPLLPFNIRILFNDTILINSPLSNLKDSIFNLVKNINDLKIKKDSNLIITDMYIQVNDYPLVFKNIDFKFLHSSAFALRIAADTSDESKDLLFALSGVEEKFTSQDGVSVRSQKLKLSWNIKQNTFSFDWYLTKYQIINYKGPQLIGVNDLIGKYLLVSLCPLSKTAKLNTLILYPFNNGFKRIWIWNDEKNLRVSSFKDCFYGQTIFPDTIWPLEDDYFLFYK